MELTTKAKDQFLHFIREPVKTLTVNKLQSEINKAAEFANQLLDEIDNNYLQPIHPRFKIQYLDVLRTRMLQVLSENYRIDGDRIINNCKTYAVANEKFDYRNEINEWNTILDKARQYEDFIQSPEAIKATKEFEDKQHSFPRIQLPHLSPSLDDVKQALSHLNHQGLLIVFQDCLNQLPGNAIPNEPELNDCLQTIFQYQLNNKKSLVLWKLIGDISLILDQLNHNSGLSYVFINPDQIECILAVLLKNKIINQNNRWLGVDRVNIRYKDASIYALIQVLFDKGYLKYRDEKKTRKAFIDYFRIDTKESTYSRIQDLPKYHDDYLIAFRKILPDGLK